ncbi:unnamed protein product [Pieris brassicae]|uniref:Arginase n=1 Tax=Pieris brassicae TaxID=7116 RepID=A0A9P0T8D1_PIEBR|nr:unnamed protein product [Pieris brassicae]
MLSNTATIIMGNNIYDWKIIETLAERHPYIVALLNNTKNYACTGVIIDHRSILTSGSCVHPEPLYAAVGSAIAGQRTNDNNIFKIAYTKAHEDYFFELGRNYNVTRMHSNIALVFTVKPVLLYFSESAILGNYFESELRDKKLSTTGYGELSNALTVLQHQRYRQVACTNPKWYYCICGVESSVVTTYDLYFGEGGPVFYGDEVIGISSFPSGLMRLKDDVRGMSQMKKWEPLKQVGVVGVPFEKGQKKYGVSIAPAAMRSAGLIEQLKEIDGLNVKDYGDIEIPACHENANVDNMACLSLVSACNKSLSSKVTQVLKDGRLAVTIGGDHSIGVGTVDGHFNVNEDMILIWVDAHADINTNKTSESGSVHGMPVALLVKELSDYWPYLPTMDWQVPKFSIKNLGYIGLRSVDHYERLAIEKYHVPTFAMEDIEDHGIAKSINHILHLLDPENKKPIHVSFDIDSLDALEAPSTGTSVRGGLTLREAIKLMEIIHSTGRLRALDLVEINPAIGNDSDRKRTIEAGLCILKAALGFSRRGTTPRGVSDLPVQTHHN